MIDTKAIKVLREKTGAGVLEIKEALEKFNGDLKKAESALGKSALTKVSKKKDRIAGEGIVHAYVHIGGKAGTLVQLACETDFVAKTAEFQNLAHELSLQVCTDDYDGVDGVLEAEYIRDPAKKVRDLIAEASAKFGEKVELVRFVRFVVH